MRGNERKWVEVCGESWRVNMAGGRHREIARLLAPRSHHQHAAERQYTRTESERSARLPSLQLAESRGTIEPHPAKTSPRQLERARDARPPEIEGGPTVVCSGESLLHCHSMLLMPASSAS